MTSSTDVLRRLTRTYLGSGAAESIGMVTVRQEPMSSLISPTAGICRDFEIWVAKPTIAPPPGAQFSCNPSPDKCLPHKQRHVGTSNIAILGLQSLQKPAPPGCKCCANPVISLSLPRDKVDLEQVFLAKSVANHNSSSQIENS